MLVIHDYRGLSPYIQDVARRVAIEGFIALAGDGLTYLGGYPGNYEDAGKMFYTADRQKMVLDFLAAARWLKASPNSTGKLGAVGFCFGGSVVNKLAVMMGARAERRRALLRERPRTRTWPGSRRPC